MLATTLKSSPAASISSPSTFSVAVESTPDTPRTASSSSSRSGGRSCRILTSKGSRARSPAAGISRVTRTFSGMAPPYFRALLFEHLSQYGLQDAAVAEVLDLDRGVHARLHLELLRFAFVARDLDGQLLARLETRKA